MFVRCSVYEIYYTHMVLQYAMQVIHRKTRNEVAAIHTPGIVVVFATNNQYVHPNKHIDYAGDLVQVENTTKQQPPVRQMTLSGCPKSERRIYYRKQLFGVQLKTLWI